MNDSIVEDKRNLLLIIIAAVSIALVISVVIWRFLSSTPVPFPIFIGNSNDAYAKIKTLPIPLNILIAVPLFFALFGFFLGCADVASHHRVVKTSFANIGLRISSIWGSKLTPLFIFGLPMLFVFYIAYIREGKIHGILDLLGAIVGSIIMGFIVAILGGTALVIGVVLPLYILTFTSFAVGYRVAGFFVKNKSLQAKK